MIYNWQKSSYSSAEGDCVEVGRDGDCIAVRDSKNKAGSVLRFSHAEWNAFLRKVRQDRS